jgi:hypothetical protein
MEPPVHKDRLDATGIADVIKRVPIEKHEVRFPTATDPEFPERPRVSSSFDRSGSQHAGW